ncbi:DUF6339 family protein [Pseudomonas frederiksbergensis]|uniref:DUF6339 family protein n=1 Tax=Pseudomonas frederiksbergensis TaxID=104087 RepID=UPI0011CD470F|nr:DUF6339 family protein [Pseudomonas frederiksbergensis]
MKLSYFSGKAIDTLREGIGGNLKCYEGDGFSNLLDEPDWSIELSLDVDLGPLADLDPSGTPTAEIDNSKLVWRALAGIKPSLAYEEGIWARLTHVECLNYSRDRWLKGIKHEDQLKKSIESHFFAKNLGERRDDNAISRLWFNGYVASQIGRDDLNSLSMILKRADSRLSFLERSLTGSRPSLASGVVRATKRHEWINSSQDSFREFMKVLNKLGGGRVFEVMAEQEVDSFMTECAVRAGMKSS